MCKERSPRQASRWGRGSRQDRFALLYLGFVMLMGLQRHACSRRNQLAAPVDVFLIRLVTLHGGEADCGTWDRGSVWVSGKRPSTSPAQRAPQHPMYPISRGSVGCTACAILLPAPSPASAFPLRSAVAVPFPVPVRGHAQEDPHPGDRQVWAAPGLAKCILRGGGIPLISPCLFSAKRGTRKGERQQLPALPAARWALPGLGIRNSGLSTCAGL